MQELVFVEKNRLEWRERPAPELDHGDAALVRPRAVARCDLDLALVTGRFPAAGPFAVGHEFVAEVLDVGDRVRNVVPGDRVVVPFQIACGACDRCHRGLTGSCNEVPFLSAFGLASLSGREWGGALSDVVRVPFADAMLVRAPEAIPDHAVAGASDNVVDGYRTVAEPLERRPNAPVLVAGGGAPSVGLYAVASAVALGASEVVYVDRSRERLQIAERLGARPVDAKASPELKVGRFPVTVDASGTPAGLHFSLASTDLEGTCTSASIYSNDVPLPLFDLYTRGIRFITGRAHARALLPAVLEKLGARAGLLESVVTRRVPWEEAADAWAVPATKLVVERR